ncbi:MAG: VWA domain-containing protein [Bacteroidota bacterium]
MTWSHPAWLLALTAVPLAAALFAWAAARRREALRRFASRDAYADSVARQRRWQAALVVVALLALGVALAGPRYGTQLREVQQEGLDVVIALDISESMRAEDVAPSRLAKAKYEIDRLLDDLAGSRVGLVVFAGEAFLQCPLTSDFGAVRLFLDAAEPSLIPTQGTNFNQALRVASQAFDGADDRLEGSEARARALLVISDGENHEGGFRPTLAQIGEDGVAVFAAGVGSAEGGPIPVLRNNRLAGYKTDRSGRTVQSQLNEAALRDLVAGGAYYRIDRSASTLPEITADLARLDRGPVASEAFETFAEQYQWPLAFALLLLAAERLVAVRRRTEDSETVDGETVDGWRGAQGSR